MPATLSQLPTDANAQLPRPPQRRARYGAKGNQALATRLGERLRAIRQKRNWAQETLARAVPCEKKCLWLVEHGQSMPTVPLLLRLCELLGVGVHHVLKGLKSTPQVKTAKAFVDVVEREAQQLTPDERQELVRRLTGKKGRKPDPRKQTSEDENAKLLAWIEVEKARRAAEAPPA